jgi:hypothetical protein
VLVDWLASDYPDTLNDIKHTTALRIFDYKRNSELIVPDQDASDISFHAWDTSQYGFDGYIDSLYPSVISHEVLDDYYIRHHFEDDRMRSTIYSFLGVGTER